MAGGLLNRVVCCWMHHVGLLMTLVYAPRGPAHDTLGLLMTLVLGAGGGTAGSATEWLTHRSWSSRRSLGPPQQPCHAGLYQHSVPHALQDGLCPPTASPQWYVPSRSLTPGPPPGPPRGPWPGLSPLSLTLPPGLSRSLTPSPPPTLPHARSPTWSLARSLTTGTLISHHWYTPSHHWYTHLSPGPYTPSHSVPRPVPRPH